MLAAGRRVSNLGQINTRYFKSYWEDFHEIRFLTFGLSSSLSLWSLYFSLTVFKSVLQVCLLNWNCEWHIYCLNVLGLFLLVMNGLVVHSQVSTIFMVLVNDSTLLLLFEWNFYSCEVISWKRGWKRLGGYSCPRLMWKMRVISANLSKEMMQLPEM